MALFHPRVIIKAIKETTFRWFEHGKILHDWAENLELKKYDAEEPNKPAFIRHILIEVLGYSDSGKVGGHTLSHEKKAGKGPVDVALGSFGGEKDEIIAVFELKGAKTRDLDMIMPGRKISPVQQAWEYAGNVPNVKWVLVSNFREIRLYRFGKGRDYESFNLETATEDNYKRLYLLLSQRNLSNGNVSKYLEESEKQEKEITDNFYKEYKEIRSKLIIELTKTNPDTSPVDIITHTQTLLDRFIFIAFAKDKRLLRKDIFDLLYQKNSFEIRPVWDIFKSMFEAVNKGHMRLEITGYNGGLFATTPELDALNVSDKACELFLKLKEYDFDIDLSVSILGHVFEQSISDLEEMKATAQGLTFNKKKSKRSKFGVFYTPPHITRYIIEQSIGNWLADRKVELGFENLPVLSEEEINDIKPNASTIKAHIKAWEAYKKVLMNISVLDPACGSGAFLNEVYDYLIREGKAISATLDYFKNGKPDDFRWDIHILTHCLYGVDINSESVEITKLSLWLKTAKQDEPLSGLDHVIKCGNSLIDDASVAGDKAFLWEKEFPEIMKSGGFDVVVGNPPYVDSELMTTGFPKERDYITTNYKYCTGNWDLYIAFFEKAYFLSNNKGYFSFITPDKWLAKPFGESLRSNLLNNLVSILQLGRDVFDQALVDSIITVFKKRKSINIKFLEITNTELNIINTVVKTQVIAPYRLDSYFSSDLNILRKIEMNANNQFSSIAVCESACATSDAYELKKYMKDLKIKFDPEKMYKVANTGTLDKYFFKWSYRPMKYLGDYYLSPIVTKKDFNNNFGETYLRRAKKPKLILKGLTKLDAAFDQTGEFIPGKTTLVVFSDEEEKLLFSLAYLNSKLVFFYIKEKYSSSSYNGGISFTKDMVNTIPLPNIQNVKIFVKKATLMLAKNRELQELSASFISLLKAELRLDKPTKALENWYTLSEPDFLAELSKKKIPLTLKQKNEWRSHFNEESVKALAIKEVIDTTDHSIDSLVYALYNLTSGEIAVIEGKN